MNHPYWIAHFQANHLNRPEPDWSGGLVSFLREVAQLAAPAADSRPEVASSHEMKTTMA